MLSNKRHLQEYAIDPVEILFSMLSQWKAVLLVSLIAAIAVSGMKYIRDVKNYNSAANAQQDEVTVAEDKDEQIESIYSGLADNDRLIVEQTMRLRNSLEAKNKYMNDSVLMHLNPYNVKVLSMTYSVSAVEDSLLISSLTKGYYATFDSSEAQEKLCTAFDNKIGANQISELVTFLNKESDEADDSSVQVKMYLPDDIDENKVADLIDSIIKSRYAELNSTIASHKIKKIYQSTEYTADSELIEQQTVAVNWVYTLQFALQNTTNVLNEAQMNAYTAICALQSAENVPSQKDTLQKPEINKKYLLAGFLMGAIVYFAVLIALSIFVPHVASPSFVEHLTKKRVIGEVYTKSKHKSLLKFLFSSNFASNLRYKEVRNADTQCTRAADILSAICKHARINKINVIDLTKDHASTNEYFKKIIKQTEAKLSKDLTLTHHSSELSESDVAEIDNVIIVADNNTRLDKLKWAVDLCKYYGHNILGSFFFGEL